MKDYIISSKVIIRTHKNSFNELKSLYETKIETLFSKTDIQDAIYIASPDLYNELKRYASIESKAKERARNSLMRYISRMSTRCTPFGLFAGCTMGTFATCTNSIFSQKSIRHTRLDMNYLCSLSQYLSDIPKIKAQLKYYPNNSLYVVGNEYRYIEYQYLKDNRAHRVSSIKKTVYLNKILQIAKKGASVEELYPCLTNEYIQKNDAINYLHGLIQAQILVSELDPTVTGEDLLTRILSILDSIKYNDQNKDALKIIQNIMKQTDMSEDDPLNNYAEVENLVKKIGAPYNRKYLFQVDIYNVFTQNAIGESIRKEIVSTVSFLNKIILAHPNDMLLKFREEFTKRFDDKEIPLLVALDPEIGFGYPIENGNKDISPLFDDFNLPNKINNSQNINYNIIQSVILKKLSEQYNALSEIEIKDDDFKNIIEQNVNLPDTFSVFFEIIKDSGNETLIRLKSISGSSAANLFARFAYTDKKIEDFVKEITQKEQSLKPDVILAEIAHLPDSRIGNVLYRPQFRNFEIAYLANSSMPKDQIIDASDIMLSIKYGKLCLRSKRLNKMIMPHLTNAHNFSLSSIPLYRFLCDIQYQDLRASLTFKIGFLINELSYIPRIRYKQTILFPATWNINVDEIKDIISIKEDEKLLFNIKQWRKKKKIPNKMFMEPSYSYRFYYLSAS